MASMDKPKNTKRVKMETFRVHAYCECGGEWRSSGSGFSTTFHTAWKHECSKCNAVASFDRTYPSIEHKAA